MELAGGTERQPILVRWLWDDCHLLGGRRAYVVEIPAERALGLLAVRSHDEADAYLEGVARQASRWPGTVTVGHVTCIVSADGRVVDSYTDPWFPYSNQWNAYCPLRRLGIRVAELADLQGIAGEQVKRSLDDDILSVWCLDPDSWDGTELEGGRG